MSDDAARRILALRAHAAWPWLDLLAFAMELPESGAEGMTDYRAAREGCQRPLDALYRALPDGTQEEGEASAQMARISFMVDEVTPALLRRWAAAWRAYAARVDPAGEREPLRMGGGWL